MRTRSVRRVLARPYAVVALTLITGPANAAKAGAVLDRLRAALPREPRLVVPTWADVDHYQRELAAAGIVFGAEVVTFSRLVRELAGAAGIPGRPLGPVARERVARAAVRDTRLDVLAASARAPGFAAAAGALFAELQRTLVGPARFTRALRTWAATGAAPAHADELAALYSAYHRRLERLGARDAEGLAREALDALRERPAAWGSRPVFLYGFDDLTPLQLDAVETLSGRVGAEVCVALPYEAGRAAFAGTRRHGRAAQAAGGRARRAARPLGALRASAPGARCTTSSAGCSSPAPRGCRPTAPCGCWRRAASARRRSSSPPRCSS